MEHEIHATDVPAGEVRTPELTMFSELRRALKEVSVTVAGAGGGTAGAVAAVFAG